MMFTQQQTPPQPQTTQGYSKPIDIPIQAYHKVEEGVSRLTNAGVETTKSVKHKVGNAMQNGLDNFRVYLREYPLLRSFVYALSLFSVVPVSVFLTYAVATFIGSVIVASIGVAIVEGGLLTMGGLVLLPFLGGGLLLTFITLAGYYGLLYTMRVLNYVFDTIRSLTSGTTANVMDTGKNITGAAVDKLTPQQQQQ